MAKIRFMSAIKEGSGRMDDIVFSSWKGRSYMRSYRKRSSESSPGQLNLRRTFSAVVQCWKRLGAAAQASWHASVGDRALTGFNLFIAANIRQHRKGLPLAIARAMGERPVEELTAGPGAAPGTLAVRCLLPVPDRHLTLFVSAPGEEDSLRRVDCGANAAMPLTVTDCVPGAPHRLYAVVTDAPYPAATTISESVAADGVAG